MGLRPTNENEKLTLVFRQSEVEVEAFAVFTEGVSPRASTLSPGASPERKVSPGGRQGQRHAMTAEDLHHFRAVGRAASGGVNHFSGFPEVRRAHDRRGYDGELFRILVAQIIEAV